MPTAPRPLEDPSSALVVVLNIPLAIAAALLALWVSGQTVNIMTLGGLALAVGILVDEATVTIENVHAHLEAAEECGPITPHAGLPTLRRDCS